MTAEPERPVQPPAAGSAGEAPETTAVRAGRGHNGGALAPILWATSAFEIAPADSRRLATTPRTSTFYTRHGNPTVRAFEDAVAALEGAEAALAFASGMGAISGVVLGLCGRGSHIVAQRQMYGGTLQLLGSVCPRFGIDVTLVDGTRPGAFAEAVEPGRTVLALAETPANPCLDLVDLDELGGLVGPITVVDSTFATPLAQRPLDHGVDLVVHSATKALAGHNDACLGVACGRPRRHRLDLGLRGAAGRHRLALRRAERAAGPAHPGRAAAPAVGDRAGGGAGARSRPPGPLGPPSGPRLAPPGRPGPPPAPPLRRPRDLRPRGRRGGGPGVPRGARRCAGWRRRWVGPRRWSAIPPRAPMRACSPRSSRRAGSRAARSACRPASRTPTTWRRTFAAASKRPARAGGLPATTPPPAMTRSRRRRSAGRPGQPVLNGPPVSGEAPGPGRRRAAHGR